MKRLFVRTVAVLVLAGFSLGCSTEEKITMPNNASPKPADLKEGHGDKAGAIKE